MKSLLLPILTFALAPASFAQSTSLQVPSAGNYIWGSFDSWDSGVPGGSDNALLGMQTFFGAPYNVQLFILAPASAASIAMESGVLLTVQDTSLNVSGEFSAEVTDFDTPGLFQPSLRATNGHVTLGGMAEYDHATGALLNDLSFSIHSEGGGNSFIQWPDADIRSLQTNIQLSGANSRFRDQAGLNALRNLRRIGGGTAIDDRFGLLQLNNHTLNLTGNLVNDGEIILSEGSVINVAGTVSGKGKFSKGTGGGGRITAGGVNATGVEFEMADTINPLDFEIEAPLINITNARVSGSGTLRGNVQMNNSDITGRNQGRTSVLVTGAAGIIIQDSRLAPKTSGVDSWSLRAMTQFYNSTSASGNFTLIGTISYTGGSIRPGLSPGAVAIQEGDFTLAGPVVLGMEIGGRTPETGHDVIRQSGGPNGTTLAGTLQVTFTDRFECEVLTTDSFTILTSDRPLMGAFGNVVSGARLTTTDGSGSFLVRYGTGAPAPNAVTLSDFQPVIVPETYTQWVTRNAIPSGQTGPNADPNGDGIPNAVAFATGLSPVGPGKPSPFASELTPAGLVISFLAPKSALGLTVTSASSTDLSIWPPGQALTAVPYSALKNRYSFTLPLTGSARRFGRFNITAAP